MTADRYAVFGNPIEHSLSPQIHAAFAAQTQQNLQYNKQRVEEGGFVAAADAFFREGGKGLNVTVPFKEDAFRYADQLTERARMAGAVNTLASTETGVLGDNTDGVGMISDITQRLGWPLQGKRVLLLGAGGAVRGVLLPCLQEKPVALVIANRTRAKAEALAQAFATFGDVTACGFDELQDEAFDVGINGTSASLAGDLPPIPGTVFAPGAAAYDMMYSAQLTPFLAWTKEQGVERVADGLGMLVGQAAEAFRLWRGVQPDVEPVLQQLRRGMR